MLIAFKCSQINIKILAKVSLIFTTFTYANGTLLHSTLHESWWHLRRITINLKITSQKASCKNVWITRILWAGLCLVWLDQQKLNKLNAIKSRNQTDLQKIIVNYEELGWSKFLNSEGKLMVSEEMHSDYFWFKILKIQEKVLKIGKMYLLFAKISSKLQ